jgi:hypothetical protein
MVRELSPESLYIITDPKNFHADMRKDVELLLANRRYLSLTTIIVLCLDALAAGSGKAERPKFESFVSQHFPDLCEALESAALQAPSPRRDKGARLLYEGFRNGFAHSRGPKVNFVIAQDHELEGAWAEWITVGERSGIALNVDRLAREFLKLLDQLESDPLGSRS